MGQLKTWRRCMALGLRQKKNPAFVYNCMQQVVTAPPEAPPSDWLIRMRRNQEAQTAFATGKARYEERDLMPEERYCEPHVSKP